MRLSGARNKGGKERIEKKESIKQIAQSMYTNLQQYMLQF